MILTPEKTIKFIRVNNQSNQSNKFISTIINIIVLWVVHNTKHFENEVEGVRCLELFE